MTHSRHSALGRSLAVALFAAALAMPLAAQDNPLRFYVLDVPNARESVETLPVAAPLDLAVGEEVVIRAALPGNRRDHFPKIVYSVSAGRENIDIQQLGNGDLRIRAVRAGSSRNGVSSQIRWSLVDESDRRNLRPNQRDGFISVRVAATSQYGQSQYGNGHDDSMDYDNGSAWYRDANEQRAYRIVDALYQGVLLRRPDGDQRSRVTSISRGGWNSVVQVADDIARSRESFEVANRVSAEDRLASLYRHLIGVDPRQVPTAEWRENLARVRAGGLPEVVEEMVRATDFAYRFGLEDRYSRSRY